MEHPVFITKVNTLPTGSKLCIIRINLFFKDSEMKVAELLKDIRKLHFVGIGGSGMFPIVEILHREGYQITGSDVNDGDLISAERNMGIPVTIGHHQSNIKGAEALIATAALLPGNPEIIHAKRLGIPVIQRAEILGYLTSRFENSICVSGTHGKTTTTSLIASILLFSGLDPAVIVGGKLPLISGYGRAGGGDTVVVEACEYVDTFLHLDPAFSVILNVDADHLDYFGSLEGVIKSFVSFAKLARKSVIANRDDKNTVDALSAIEGDKRIIWFGEDPEADYVITDIINTGKARYSFTLGKDGKNIGGFSLQIPGKHNIHNAAAAAVTAFENGCSKEDIQKGFDSFLGAGRRFEILGERRGVTVADDYAHHPSEIKVTLSAAKDMGFDRIWAVFQPFTFSRTKQLLQEFADSLGVADRVVLTEIMGSREKNTFGVYTTDLVERIPGSVWFSEFEDVAGYCARNAGRNDLVITLGCGDIYKAARLIYEKLAE